MDNLVALSAAPRRQRVRNWTAITPWIIINIKKEQKMLEYVSGVEIWQISSDACSVAEARKLPGPVADRYFRGISVGNGLYDLKKAF